MVTAGVGKATRIHTSGRRTHGVWTTGVRASGDRASSQRTAGVDGAGVGKAARLHTSGRRTRGVQTAGARARGDQTFGCGKVSRADGWCPDAGSHKGRSAGARMAGGGTAGVGGAGGRRGQRLESRRPARVPTCGVPRWVATRTEDGTPAADVRILCADARTRIRTSGACLASMPGIVSRFALHIAVEDRLVQG